MGLDYDTYLDHERYGLEEREEDATYAVYMIHDGYRNVSQHLYYNLKDAQRQFDAIPDGDGNIYLGEIDENDIDPMDWEATKRLMVTIDKK